MSTSTLQPYRVTVELSRPAGNSGLMPPDALVLAEAAAAAVGAEDLMGAWTSVRALLLMTVEASCEAGALSAGRAVARSLGDADTAAVEAAEMPKSARSEAPGCHG